ncbi:hypothetical protein P9852_27 [Streptococcus phage P9852]|uniref:Uncharacterized protein n=1 Tax=Streptococcus phage P9852 TaxID=1971444 RepID=A0A286QRP8_9CAUD|nr:hypothetical protein P9852_27 [Streptococcus phage P9852]
MAFAPIVIQYLKFLKNKSVFCSEYGKTKITIL